MKAYVPNLRLLHPLIPDYPEAAKKEGLTGFVQLIAVVNEKGEVEQTEDYLGAEVFLASALKAAALARFRPDFGPLYGTTSQ